MRALPVLRTWLLPASAPVQLVFPLRVCRWTYLIVMTQHRFLLAWHQAASCLQSIVMNQCLHQRNKHARTTECMHTYIAKRIVHTPFSITGTIIRQIQIFGKTARESNKSVAQATSKRFTDMEFRYCAFCHDGFWKPTRLGFAIRYICQADLWDREGSCNNYDVMYVDVIVVFWFIDRSLVPVR